jgi:hypothetical protein
MRANDRRPVEGKGMSRGTTLTLCALVPDAPSYVIGDEIWQVGLADAIAEEADTIANLAGVDLLEEPTDACRNALRIRVIQEMIDALVASGDTYTAPDGVAYTLTSQPESDRRREPDTLDPVTDALPDPVVDEVLSFESLPVGSSADRRAIVRWSDGTEGQALAWYSDEILICEGDLIGKTMLELRSLHFRRDQDWLQS